MSFTESELNAAKFAKILFKHGRDALEYQTTCLITQMKYKDIEDFFEKNYTSIENKSDKQYPFRIIYKKLSGNDGKKRKVINLEEFDLSSISYIITNVLIDKTFPNNNSVNINDNERNEVIEKIKNTKQNCNELRDLRNKFYGHLIKFEIPSELPKELQNDKYKTFKEIYNHLKRCIQSLCDVKKQLNIQAEVKSILELKLENVQEIESIKRDCFSELLKDTDLFQSFLAQILKHIESSPTKLQLDDLKNNIISLNNKISQSLNSKESNNEIISEIIQIGNSLKDEFKDFKEFLACKDELIESNKKIFSSVVETKSCINQGFQGIHDRLNNSLDEFAGKLKINANQLKQIFTNKDFNENCYKTLILTERSSSEDSKSIQPSIGGMISSYNWDAVIDLDKTCEHETNPICKIISSEFLKRHNREFSFCTLDKISDQDESMIFDNIYIFGNGSEKRVQPYKLITGSIFSRHMSIFF